MTNMHLYTQYNKMIKINIMKKKKKTKMNEEEKRQFVGYSNITLRKKRQSKCAFSLSRVKNKQVVIRDLAFWRKLTNCVP